MLAVIAADCKMDSKAFRKVIGCKSTRFASPEEVAGRVGNRRPAPPHTWCLPSGSSTHGHGAPPQALKVAFLARWRACHGWCRRAASWSRAASTQHTWLAPCFLPPAQVAAVTGCVPGAVPPFGSAWGLKTYVDASLKKQVIVPLQVESSQT